MRLLSSVLTASMVLVGAASLLFLGSDEKTPEEMLTTAEPEAHLRFLASDELMGRAAGTTGGATAARYIAEQFRAAGLTPLGDGGQFFQRVPLAMVGPPAAATLRLALLQCRIQAAYVTYTTAHGNAGSLTH